MVRSRNIQRIPLILQGQRVGHIFIRRTRLQRVIQDSLLAHPGPAVTDPAVREFEEYLLDEIARQGPTLPDGWLDTVFDGLRRAVAQQSDAFPERRDRVYELLMSEVPDDRGGRWGDRLTAAMVNKDAAAIDNFGHDIKRIANIRRGNKPQPRDAETLAAAQADYRRFHARIEKARTTKRGLELVEIKRIMATEMPRWSERHSAIAIEKILRGRSLGRIRPSVLARRLAALKYPGLSEATLR
jgi:hypothetical protein